jgi:hypothetical protein
MGGGMMADEVSRLKGRISELLIGVFTEDFSLIHDLTRIFRDKGCGFIPLARNEPIDGRIDCLIIDGNMDIPLRSGNKNTVIEALSDPLNTADRAIACALGKLFPDQLIIGIDPGKRPGIAFVADGILIDARTTTDPRIVNDIVTRSIRAYEPRNMLIRIGVGDPKNRDLIIDGLRAGGFLIEVVDETMTTIGSRYRDENAAVRIARTSGVPLHNVNIDST